jgi:hypothetical protein
MKDGKDGKDDPEGGCHCGCWTPAFGITRLVELYNVEKVVQAMTAHKQKKARK